MLSFVPKKPFGRKQVCNAALLTQYAALLGKNTKRIPFRPGRPFFRLFRPIRDALFFDPDGQFSSVYPEEGLAVVSDDYLVVVASRDLVPRLIGMRYAY